MLPLVLAASVRLNDLEEAYEGGRLLLHADDAAVAAAGLLQVELIVNAPSDAVLAQFPSTRAEKARRRFRLTLEEVTDAGPDAAPDAGLPG